MYWVGTCIDLLKHKQLREVIQVQLHVTIAN